MTTRIHSELRKLALAYYRGWVPRDRYLEIRQKYLRSITNGDTPAAIDPKNIAKPKRKAPSSASSPATQSGNKKWLLLTASVGILLLVVLAIYLGNDSPPQKPAPVVNETPTQVTTAKPVPLTDEQRFNNFLKDNFIGQHTWKQDALNSLKLKWLGLSQEQQNTVSNTKVFQDFSGALIERIVDERKLNNIVPSDYELALMTAAKNMGMINAIPDP